ncbi:hypothetical protein [Umezawaea sp.]|uniref:hypothetical protein n=1 Tax=Umezawaea sp. TaxID=1955258 RepID=UPI002ED35CBB
MNTREDDRALFDGLACYLSEVELAGVDAIGAKLVQAAGGVDELADYKVMVAYGGGKDSTYVVAFVRAVQLRLRLDHDRTFVMRVANMRHAGVPQAVMDNIDRVYRVLGLLDDERAELLTVDHTEVRPFRRDLPMPDRLRAVNRLDVLMNGHRSAGDGRPTFCNSCNLAVADFYGRVVWWRGGVDAVMTGDSRREQALYAAWIRRLAVECGIDVASTRGMGFGAVLTALRGIGEAYVRELFGEDSAAELAEREVSAGDPSSEPVFMSIYDLVGYRVHDHWKLIVDFLGFRFDDLAFSFTESDCGNPSLMAHLRGLRARYVAGRTYEEGVTEYLRLAEQLMRMKEMPDELIRLATGRYGTPEGMAERRRIAEEFAGDAFDLSEDALVAMVFSPFTDGGERLRAFLERCHPARLGDEPALRAVLRGDSDDPDAVAWLEGVSALSVARLRTLYRSALVDFHDKESMIARVRAGDPHKHRVQTVDPRNGQRVSEVISGR